MSFISSRDSFQKDIVVYRFRNVHGVTSYKIFSLRSPLVREQIIVGRKLIYSLMKKMLHISMPFLNIDIILAQ